MRLLSLFMLLTGGNKTKPNSSEEKGIEKDDYSDRIAQYRASLQQLEQQMQATYDKSVMTLSGAALGLSMTFIKDIADKSNLNATGWLLASWIVWGASITFILSSFFTSTLALQKAVQQTDENKIHDEPRGGIYNIFTNFLNVVAGILFVAGVITFCVFMKGNMP
ncbi:MAG: hypothetical protein V2A78_02065 [bacterium]